MDNRRKFYKSLFFQLGITITSFIVLVEVGLLIASYRSKEKQLFEIRTAVMNEVAERFDVADPSSYPLSVLSDEDINERLNEFVRNVTGLVFIIIAVVVGGTLYIFNWLVIRHILELRRLNYKIAKGEAGFYPSEKIPDSELGDVIVTRNSALKSLHRLGKNLQGELESAKTQLVQTAKLSTVGELTASVAHDLRNPLTVIQGHIMILKKNASDGQVTPEKVMASVEKIEFAYGRMKRLVESMNQFNRSEFTLKEGVSLVQVMENSLLLVDAKLRKSGATIERDMPQALDQVWADPASLEQVVVNLLSNAIDAMENEKKKTIWVSLEDQGEQVKIKILDSGPGIPDEVGETLFTPFVTTKAAGKGTGLGLSICYQIINKHQGTIRVTNAPEGGACFEVLLWKKKPKGSHGYGPDDIEDLGDQEIPRAA